ncbi:RNA polymerase sigma factor [Fervidobacterium nodosum]|uniref:Uncharacterized protein n=1 Tax=Fervidobacterium nodosum (strain ATCC 35602 / DSM 5306 / Rt17-B1) TaxID=381764 RepID=A7HMW2_FERNB|nr:sigma-70 family RNA polymerase sigma factor [Fervidobacterium nodosum]ABS61245.1 hypothetical protein Fnod_1399 [Fervidobacterium nodosum Rt17-B1]
MSQLRDFKKIGRCLRLYIRTGNFSSECEGVIKSFIRHIIYNTPGFSFGASRSLSNDALVDDISQEVLSAFWNVRQRLESITDDAALTNYFMRSVKNKIQDYRRANIRASSVVSLNQSIASNDDEYSEMLDFVPDKGSEIEQFDEVIAEYIFDSFVSYMRSKEADICDYIFFSLLAQSTHFREYSSTDAMYKAHQRARDRVKAFFEKEVSVSYGVIKKILKRFVSEICESLRNNN